ncbi:protein of unknown function [bacterium A37T11]|nr:protein of unknown function [bacterium A37T11]
MDKKTKISSYVLFIGCILFFLTGCKQEEVISLGNEEQSMGAEIVDSLTVNATTFLLDPLPTAGTGVLLTGKLDDGDLGKLNVSTYFRTGISVLDATLPDGAVYDSISLLLQYNHYYYGDTTKLQHLNLYRLSDEMELKDIPTTVEDDEKPVFVSGSTFWADQELNHDATVLGSVSFKPHPLSGRDTVKIKVSDDLGHTLFNMAKNADARLKNAEDFASFIKGFVLKPDGDGGCVTGFRDSVLLNVHYSYHRETDGMQVHDSLVFNLSETAYQFNAVTADRSGGKLAALVQKRSEVPASQTGNQTYIQGSTGIVTRLSFPTLREFVNQSNLAISKAELVIQTSPKTQTLYGPPSVLNLMIANKYGTPISLLTASYGSGAQNSYLVKGNNGGSNGQYVFNLTQYVSNQRNATSDLNQSLLLTLPVTNLMNSVNRLVVAAGDDKPSIKLRILYVKF